MKIARKGLAKKFSFVFLTCWRALAQISEGNGAFMPIGARRLPQASTEKARGRMSQHFERKLFLVPEENVFCIFANCVKFGARWVKSRTLTSRETPVQLL